MLLINSAFNERKKEKNCQKKDGILLIMIGFV